MLPKPSLGGMPIGENLELILVTDLFAGST
jgi:hypothetical protein